MRGNLHTTYVPPHKVIKHDHKDWDRAFYRMAVEVGKLSKDPRRKVGAVIVTPDRRQLSMGYNGFPSNILDTHGRLEDRDYCREHMIHAEDNCIAQSAFSAEGGTLYVTRFPCSMCAGKIVQAKLARVVAPMPDINHPRWGMSWIDALHQFNHLKVQTYLCRVDEFEGESSGY